MEKSTANTTKSKLHHTIPKQHRPTSLTIIDPDKQDDINTDFHFVLHCDVLRSSTLWLMIIWVIVITCMVIIVRAKIHCHPSLHTSTSLPLELGCDCNSVHYIPQTVKPNGNPHCNPISTNTNSTKSHQSIVSDDKSIQFSWSNVVPENPNSGLKDLPNPTIQLQNMCLWECWSQQLW